MTLKNDSPQLPPDRQSDASRINLALDHILSSGPFTSSRQSQKLLRYLVEKSLTEDEESLKERVIGMEVFDRSSDYNTGDDPIVRARVGEVRKRLAQYYQSELNNVPAVRLEIPIGSYRVLFHFPSVDLEAPLAQDALSQQLPKVNIPPLAPDVDPASSYSKLRVGIGSATLVLILAVLAFAVYFRHGHHHPVMNAFWSPLVNASPTIYVYIGANSAYMPTAAYMKRFRESHPLDEDQIQGTDIRIDWLKPNEILRAGDVYPENDDLVSTGNVAACVAISMLLASMQRTPDVRSGQGLSPEDVKNSAAIFIGAFDNKWTMQLSADLPFRFDLRSNETDLIVERDGQHREWKTHVVGGNGEPAAGPYGQALEEYAIVARLSQSKLRKPVVIAAGLRARGTRAAGDFVADPAATDLLLKNAPANWSHNNVEAVLETDVIKGEPGPARVIAARYW
jgi:hypothetical protein